MTAVLLVRMSSLGDIIHTFPVLTDICRHLPRTAIHWMVEEQYIDLARLHPMLDHVVPVALRRWQRAPFAASTWRGVAELRRRLAGFRPDAVIEAQGLVKSAMMARLAHGPVHGFGPHTAREWLASRFYDYTYEFAPTDHKIFRYRSLAARALGYAFTPAVEYGLAVPPAPTFTPKGDFCVLAHATARAGKLWREAAWITIANALAHRGLVCMLPWGDEAEKARAERIAAAAPGALLAPRMSIGEAAGLLARARVVIGLDTGFTHLAAAFSVPVVGVFCDSEPVDARPVGRGRAAYRGGIGHPPSADEVLAAIAEVVPELV